MDAGVIFNYVGVQTTITVYLVMTTIHRAFQLKYKDSPGFELGQKEA